MKTKMLDKSNPYSMDAPKKEDLDMIATKVQLSSFADVRDVALFSSQFECMRRISELLAIEIDDIRFSIDRYAIRINRTKTGKYGDTRDVIVQNGLYSFKLLLVTSVLI